MKFADSGAVNDPLGINAMDPQGRDEGERLPVTVHALAESMPG
jgi:hypothetical protein